MFKMKAILVAAAVFVVAEALNQDGLGKNVEKFRKFNDFVSIGGDIYFINTEVGYLRDKANDVCSSMNMTLVSFEREEKWRDLNLWLTQNDFGLYWFWTDALKDEGSTTWYWETSGEEIVDLNWAPGQPDLNSLPDRLCMDFASYMGGYDDEICDQRAFGAICQYN